MKATQTKIVTLFQDSIKDFFANEGMKLSASLSYYTIFALPSFAIVLITILGYFLEEELVSGTLFRQINKMIGSQATDQLEDVVKNSHLNYSSIFETIVGMVALVLSATGMFGEIQSSINDIWKIKAKPKKGIIHAIVDQFFSFSMILIFGMLLFISLLIDSFIDVLYNKLAIFYNNDSVFIADFIDGFFVFILVTFLIFYIFKELPDGKIKVKDVFVGALFTATLFMVGKWLIGFYIENTNKFTLYGTAGSILILLVWVYYSAIILYFGAVFTKNYAQLYGTPIQPNEYSEFTE